MPARVDAAVPAPVGPLLITIPEGFQAAQTQRLKKKLITAWTKSARHGSLKTLLQINVTDVGSPTGKPVAPADLYLHQSLDETARRRSNFSSSPVAHITLAGAPAVRATWNGAIGERTMVGVLYAVVIHNRYAVVFHTQDLGDTPSSGMFEAMKAIETATAADSAAPQNPDGNPSGHPGTNAGGHPPTAPNPG